ncbi:conserved oligomeric Golgi complex subunit 4, putative, partial [Hepatocystis sp. ex Piliocolobus tephrosceles]
MSKGYEYDCLSDESSKSSESSENDDTDNYSDNANINEISKYIENIDTLNSSLDLKIKLNQQKEKENFVNNIDDINT